MEGELTNTTGERAQLSQSLAETETQLLTLRRQAEELAAALTLTARHEKALEQAVGLAEARINELSDDRDALLIERDDLRGSLSDVEKVRAEQGGRLNEVSERAEKLATQLSVVEGELARARGELDRTSQDATSQERALKNVLDEREQRLSTALRGIEELQLELTSERETRGAVETAGEAAQRTVEETGKALEEAKLELTLLREDRQRTQAVLEATQKTLAELTDNRDLLDLERLEIEKKYRSLETDAKLAVDRTGELETQIRKLLGDAREAEAKAVSAREELKEHSAQALREVEAKAASEREEL